MKSIPAFLTLLFNLAIVLCPLRAEAPNPAAQIRGAFDLYGQAWREPDAGIRDRLLAQAWAPAGVYKDPSVTLTGPAALSRHIGEFIKRYPHAQFSTTSRLDTHGTAFRCTWLLVFGDAMTPPLEGVDYGELASDGRIAAITGFFGPLPHQQIAANEAVVGSYLEALFQRYDLAALDKIIAPDALYHQAAGLPYGGQYRGLSEMVTMFTKAQTYFNLQLVAPPTLATDPATNQVIASFTIRCVAHKSGRELTMAIRECFELRDGKIVGITPFYFDTKTFAAFLAEEKLPLAATGTAPHSAPAVSAQTGS